MAAPSIFLVRHGKTHKDLHKRYLGWTDVPLSEEGRDQALALGRAFSSFHFAQIVSSDLARASTTAEIIARMQKGAVRTNLGLREINLGAWEGLAFSEIRERFPEEFNRRGRDLTGYRPPGGENFRDLAHRVVPIFQELVSQAEGPLLLVSHIGVIRVILAQVLGLPLENIFRIDHDYGAYSLIQARDSGLRLISHNLKP
ncbi:MAG: alpha-ribazole phosphatase [Pseudomonadota bacterium]